MDFSGTDDGHSNCGDRDIETESYRDQCIHQLLGSLRNMQRKAGFGFGIRKLRGTLAGSREACALARPPTSCETLRKSFSVSGPQAFLPVK